MTGRFHLVNFYTFLAVARFFLVSGIFFAVFLMLVMKLPPAYWHVMETLRIDPKTVLKFVYILCFAQLFEVFVKWK